jgi:hypothetical protein
VDFALVEVIDIDVVVVIRFVAMEIIPEERLAQEKAEAKERLKKRLRAVHKMSLDGQQFPALEGMQLARLPAPCH